MWIYLWEFVFISSVSALFSPRDNNVLRFSFPLSIGVKFLQRKIVKDNILWPRTSCYLKFLPISLCIKCVIQNAIQNFLAEKEEHVKKSRACLEDAWDYGVVPFLWGRDICGMYRCVPLPRLQVTPAHGFQRSCYPDGWPRVLRWQHLLLEKIVLNDIWLLDYEFRTWQFSTSLSPSVNEPQTWIYFHGVFFPLRWRTHGAAWRHRVWRRPATGGRWWWTRGSRCRPGAASTSSASRAAPPPPTTRTPRTRAATRRPSAGPAPTPPSGTSSFFWSHFEVAGLHGPISDTPSLKDQIFFHSLIVSSLLSLVLSETQCRLRHKPLSAQTLCFFSGLQTQTFN